MSYDYNALVTSLAMHRANASEARSTSTTTTSDDISSKTYVEHVQEALQVFDTLSGHCPMTPLLWMQYAYDMYELMTSLSSATTTTSSSDAALAVARKTRLETLEVGLGEFPGSAVLQLHYCELLVENLVMMANAAATSDADDTDDDDDQEAVQTALQKALQQVGSGSHRNESHIVAQLYRLHVYYCGSSFSGQEEDGAELVLASLLQRARTPMDDANDSLMEEVKDAVGNNAMPTDFLPALEESRRWEAKTFSGLRSCEDEITMAMQQEGIAWKESVDFAPPDATDGGDATVKTAPTFPFVTTASSSSSEFEDTVLKGKPLDQQPSYWNGLGAGATAQAFLQYSTACRKFRFPRDNDGDDDNKEDDDGDNKNDSDDGRDDKKKQQLILSVFERGIAECPTVEGLWLVYLKHVTWLWNNADPNGNTRPLPQTLKTLTTRAARNCPFSLKLVQQQLDVALLLSNNNHDQGDASAGDHVMDPEELLTIVTKALDAKFLPAPAQTYDLFATAIRVIQRRILSILATASLGFDPLTSNKKGKDKVATILKFDEAELTPSKTPKPKPKPTPKKGPSQEALVAPTANSLDKDAWTEVQDLCEEMRDMFAEAIKRINADHASWTEGRAMLQQEWGQMEQVVICALSAISSPENVMSSNTNSDNDDHLQPLSHFEKAIRMHNPPHPDSYRNLIQHVLNNGALPHSVAAVNRSPGDVVARLRQVRGLYQKAIHSVGKGRIKDDAPVVALTPPTTSVLRDYETALSCLCQDYQEFERLFGSEQSLANATRMMQHKLQKTSFQRNRELERQPAPMDVDDEDDSPKGKRKSSDADGPAAKKRKTGGDADDTKEAKPVVVVSKKRFKVKVGHIFHKAHPFTVRVTNLAAETGEMDLLESFRQKHECGAIVHARIQRERPFQGNEGVSKGWGLVQFEERESVEKALKLGDKLKIDGNIIQVERSHVPAVGLVPPGMHRAGFAQKKKPWKGKTDAVDKQEPSTKPAGDVASKPAVVTTKPGNVLAFRPRVVKKKPSKR